MRATVRGTLSGTVQVPPSKSVAHRMLICAALASEPCTIVCHSVNRDMEATVQCLNALGARISYDGGSFSITPISKVTKGATLDCAESGSTLRFLLPVAAALGADAVFTGQGRLPNRPLSPLYEEMTAHGIRMSENGRMPLTCQGTQRGRDHRDLCRAAGEPAGQAVGERNEELRYACLFKECTEYDKYHDVFGTNVDRC